MSKKYVISLCQTLLLKILNRFGLVCLFIFLGCFKLYSQVVIYDNEGNSYNTVTIGSQVWMKENLKTRTYNDGTSIVRIDSNSGWYSNFTTPAYTVYNNDNSLINDYGILYNWLAATNSKGVCPAGWIIPSLADWDAMIDYLGGSDVAGGKLKQTGYEFWSSPNSAATNSSGFTAIPSGMRAAATGEFYHLGKLAAWWTSTEYDDENAYIRNVWYNSGEIERGMGKFVGFSVRCINDEPLSLINEQNIDINVYPNPTTGIINISIPKSFSSSEIRIIDLEGRLVNKFLNSNSENISVNLSNMPNGLYFVYVYSADRLIAIQRFIIER